MIRLALQPELFFIGIVVFIINFYYIIYFQRIADMNLRNPRMIGFGISNKQTFETASAHAAGAIIGSKFVTLLDEEDGDTEKAADKLLEALKN